MPQRIAQRIKDRRKELGLSQDNLAKACDVGQSTVANWESGSHIPRQASLQKIAKALETNDIWLLSGEHMNKRGTLESYLQKPIHHVPVYIWPLPGNRLEEAAPDAYIPISSHHKNLFAMTLGTKKDDFKAGTILIFTRDEAFSEQGYVLDITEGAYNLSKQRSDNNYAKLLYSLTAH
ncbi:helix-turn-helix domain-containing protein [Hellea balneolensis]|uniref:helix-turn-helix domain-containing protein n=1 Tax=Hellea balneolensis TaxID=287478 RepID=UPI00042063A4|nr:LexA family transcriptional regulator [Hellea balneolensis]